MAMTCDAKFVGVDVVAAQSEAGERGVRHWCGIELEFLGSNLKRALKFSGHLSKKMGAPDWPIKYPSFSIAYPPSATPAT
jgi:hypothetical protein